MANGSTDNATRIMDTYGPIENGQITYFGVVSDVGWGACSLFIACPNANKYKWPSPVNVHVFVDNSTVDVPMGWSNESSLGVVYSTTQNTTIGGRWAQGTISGIVHK